MRAWLREWGGGRFVDHAAGTASRGTLAGWSMILLLALSIGVVTAQTWLSSGMVAQTSVLAGFPELQEILAVAKGVVSALEGDTTPDAESQHDVVWDYLRRLERSGEQVGLRDLSSNGSTRVYSNVNSTPPASLRETLIRRGVVSDQAREIVHLIADRQRAVRTLSSQDLTSLLGPLYPQVVPFVGLLPEVNVNFAPRERIVEVIARSAGQREASGVEEVADALVLERDQRELTADSLARLLSESGLATGEPENLGVHTWVWEIHHRRERGEYLVRVVRLAGTDRPDYQVVGAGWKR